MAGRLTPEQIAALAWINEGCPDEALQPGRIAAMYSVAGRGYAVIKKRAGVYRASITPAGKGHLDSLARWPSKRAGDSIVSPESLVAKLQNDGEIRLDDPTDMARAAYRSAINRANSGSACPEGFEIKYTGRDRGPLTIRLAEVVPDLVEPASAVPMPSVVSHPVARDLKRRGRESFDVGKDSRQRAALIVQALADECDRRGHDLVAGTDLGAAFVIRLRSDSFRFCIREEFTRRPRGTAQLPKGQQPKRERSGLLTMYERRTVSYRDRIVKTWSDRGAGATLDSSLDQVITYVEAEARSVAHERALDEIRIEAKYRQDLRRWNENVDEAVRTNEANHNESRLSEQLSRRRRAEEMRAYAVLVRGSGDEPGLREWATWIEQQADEVDPLQDLDELHYLRIPRAAADSSDLNALMPRWQTAGNPPLAPRWLRE